MGLGWKKLLVKTPNGYTFEVKGYSSSIISKVYIFWTFNGTTCTYFSTFVREFTLNAFGFGDLLSEELR